MRRSALDDGKFTLRGTQEHGAFRRRPPAEALRRRLALSFPFFVRVV
jgi:hypothetical protein